MAWGLILTAAAGCTYLRPSHLLFRTVSLQSIPGLSGDQRFASWSPDGTSLAVMSNASGNWDIWTVRPDGTQLRQLTHEPSSEYTAAWSPDGRWLIFSSDRVHRIWPNLWRLNPQQPEPAEPFSQANGKYFFPAWSPDGTQLAFLYLPTGPPSFELRTMAVPGRKSRMLSNNGIVFSPPAWSPDGTRIAFASNRSGTSKLWILTLDTGALRQLLRGPSQEMQPSWSPDGRFLAFTSDRSGNSDIWVMDLSATGAGDGAEPPLQQLTRSPSTDHYPQWSPDGRRLVFVSTRSGHEALWLIDLAP
ncbi:MAG TPA: hypothetical protein VLY45_03150 [Nitrospiria bacterium]|nr:hypothetical protein [Nitrospiria bacterium]